MYYCCELFADLVGNAGQRGFSALPRSESGQNYFCLQARAGDTAEMDSLHHELIELSRLSQGKIGVKGKLLLGVQQGIKYCPFCGANLEKWIKKHKEEFEKSALNLKHLVL